MKTTTRKNTSEWLLPASRACHDSESRASFLRTAGPRIAAATLRLPWSPLEVHGHEHGHDRDRSLAGLREMHTRWAGVPTTAVSTLADSFLSPEQSVRERSPRMIRMLSRRSSDNTP